MWRFSPVQVILIQGGEEDDLHDSLSANQKWRNLLDEWWNIFKKTVTTSAPTILQLLRQRWAGLTRVSTDSLYFSHTALLVIFSGLFWKRNHSCTQRSLSGNSPANICGRGYWGSVDTPIWTAASTKLLNLRCRRLLKWICYSVSQYSTAQVHNFSHTHTYTCQQHIQV